MTNNLRSSGLQDYMEEWARDRDVAHRAEAELVALLDTIKRLSGMNVFDIKSRVKTWDSFRKKAESVGDDEETPRYSDPTAEITDTLGARIIVYTSNDAERFKDLVEQKFDVVENSDAAVRRDGYHSIHVVVGGLSDAAEYRAYANLHDFLERRRVELQIRTVAEHAWSEVSHSIKYKSSKEYKKLDPYDLGRIDQMFMAAAGYRKQMDDVFASIHGLVFPDAPSSATAVSVPARVSENDNAPVTAERLGALLAELYPESTAPAASDLDWAIGTLERLEVDHPDLNFSKVTTVDELRRLLTLAEESRGDLEALLGYAGEDVDRIRRFDDDLLYTLRDAYVDAETDDAEADRLSLRLAAMSGKRKVYRIEGPEDATEEDLTGAAALRELVRLIVEAGGIDAANISSVVSDDPTETFRSRFNIVPTSHGEVRVNANMNRAWIEQSLRQLIGRWSEISDEPLAVTRAGDSV